MSSSSSTSSSSTVDSYGGELIVNGTFLESSSGWSLSGGAYYDSGKISFGTGGSPVKSISQLVPIYSGRQYRVQYSFTRTSGVSSSSISMAGVTIPNGNTTGTIVNILNSLSDDPLNVVVSLVSGLSSITNVSVREVQKESSSSSQSSSFSSLSSSSSLTVYLTSSSSSLSSLNSSSSSSSSSSEALTSSSSSSSEALTSSSSSSEALTSSSSSSSEALTSSSSSSISSDSSIAMSSSSSSSLSSSSYSSSSSSNSSSTVSTSSSGTSSSSSLFQGEHSLRFSFEIEKNNKALCFCRNEDKVYAGLSFDGKVLVSSNLSKWDSFVQIEDESVTSMISWANGLFMGTSPGGMIWVNNFSTGNCYKFVQTKDQCVSAFAIYNNKLYAGTSPQGIIYSFDGNVWKEEYMAYGSGITSMSGGDVLNVFMKEAETPIFYDGQKWQPFSKTIASFRYSSSIKNDPISNPYPCHNIYSSTVDEGSVVFGGQRGAIYKGNRDNISRIFQTDMGDVSSIVNIGTGMNLAAIGNVIYLLEEDTAVPT